VKRRLIFRGIALGLGFWLIGFIWFILALPGPAGNQKTDAIVVLTGGKGRIERGIEMLAKGYAQRLLVSGVYPRVSEARLATIKRAPPRLFTCCIDLGKMAVNTRTNAQETAQWMARNHFQSLRLITTDWHMPRARFELEQVIDPKIIIIEDGVKSHQGVYGLLIEYQKLLTRRIASLFNAD
jgi:uncharacterized SAM-binding protein YcdF (DUF218 family)